MSLVRFGTDGFDVCVYESDRGLECCGCWLEDTSPSFETTDQMIDHLKLHAAAGHHIPQYVFDELHFDYVIGE